MAILIKATGFLLSLLPYPVLELLTKLLAELFMIVPSSRRRVLLSNLRHAFPEWEHSKIYSTAKTSSAYMLEMGLFSLAYPFFSYDQRKRTISFPHETEEKLAQLRKSGKPVLFLLPHVCLFETLATSPYFRPQGSRKLGAIYRPNRNPKIDQWINRSRISTGLETFSRDRGFWDAKSFLEKGNWLVLLFDQHSGTQGSLSLFLNRLASISTLPSLLARSADSINVIAFPKRIGFFRTSLELKLIKKDISLIPYEAHSFLQNKMELNGGLPEWLWCHERWKTQQQYQFHLRLRYKRQSLPAKLPRTTKFWIRMPNWLGDVVMTFPLLDAIRRGRPDASLTLLAKPGFQELLLNLGTSDGFIALPSGIEGNSSQAFLKHRREYPSLIINFANSLRSDLECFGLGAPRRYGVCLAGRKRPLLTHSYDPTHSHTEEGREIHQVRLWEQMLQYFGLDQELNLSPIVLPAEKNPAKIGIMPGSANNPSKCWPLENWKDLIKSIQSNNKEVQINVFGASAEASLANSIASEFSESKVVNRCGKTNLWQLAQELSTCIWVTGNDSGGMHLSNSLGVPSIVLFGPTQSTCTKPIFDSPLTILEDAFASPTESVNAICEKVFRTEPVSDLSVQFN